MLNKDDEILTRISDRSTVRRYSIKLASVENRFFNAMAVDIEHPGT